MAQLHKIINLADLPQYTGLEIEQIEQFIEQRLFPYPLKLGEGETGWLVSDIADWQDRLIEMREENILWFNAE